MVNFYRRNKSAGCFGEYYYSSSWQQVFAVDNSFVLWGLGLGIALWVRRPVWIAFAGAGLLHLVFDFPVHNHDARMHFWPLSDWTFISPIILGQSLPRCVLSQRLKSDWR